MIEGFHNTATEAGHAALGATPDGDPPPAWIVGRIAWGARSVVSLLGSKLYGQTRVLLVQSHVQTDLHMACRDTF